MQVTLISTYFDIESIGLRMLSAVLRREGHHTRVIYLASTQLQSFGIAQTNYPDPAIRDVIELCRGSDLVGMTLMTNNYLTAKHLTEQIKAAIPAPVVWGGIHPTVRPEESIQTADYLCIGEGETATSELVRKLEAGEDTTNIQNIWARKGDQVIQNDVRPLIADLDGLPYMDYSLEDHHILQGERVVPMTHGHQESWSLYRYKTSTSRGCILNCSFCCHNAYRKTYGATAGNTRRRSVEHFLGELEWVREHMPYVNYVVIDDDSFMDASLEYITELSTKWKERIGLPFKITGFIPITVTEEKTRLLAEAGLHNVRMGIQSGAQNTKRIYRRNIKDSVILRAANIFDQYRSSIRVPNYDLILDNPWETDEDRAETLRLMQALPRPYIVQFFSLTFYPGTDLYHRAKTEGYIKDDIEDVYRKDYLRVHKTYMNGLAFLFGAYRVPKPIEKLLLHPKVMARKPDFLFWPLWFMGWPMYLVLRGVRYLLDGNHKLLMRWARLAGQKVKHKAVTASQYA